MYFMQDAAQPNALQLLFIELRVGLARSAIQSALLLNGAGAIVVLLFFSDLLAAPVGHGVNMPLLKWAVGVFGIGLFLGAITFVNAYVAQGALASGRSTFFGDSLRRLGLGLIIASLLLFLLGVALAVAAI
jgi:hypothetical protein